MIYKSTKKFVTSESGSWVNKLAIWITKPGKASTNHQWSENNRPPRPTPRIECVNVMWTRLVSHVNSGLVVIHKQFIS